MNAFEQLSHHQPLFAEARGYLPVAASAGYRAHSLRRRLDAVIATVEAGRDFDARATDIWSDLQETFDAGYAVPYLANAYMIADGDENRAVRLYASGYYASAKKARLLSKLRTAASQPVRPTGRRAPPRKDRGHLPRYQEGRCPRPGWGTRTRT